MFLSGNIRVGLSRSRCVALQPKSMRLNSNSPNQPLTLSYRIYGTTETVTQTFVSLESFRDIFRGWSFTVNNITASPINLDQSNVDPAVVYEVHNLNYMASREGLSHNQISDKAFEEKSIRCLERHLQPSGVQRQVAQNPDRVDGWRYLTAETDIPEWEGIWQGPDGHVYLLEAKHAVDATKLSRIGTKFKRSIEFLKIDPSSATVYVAGKYWGVEAVDLAETLGFGIIQENGVDLDITEPKVDCKVTRGKAAKRKKSP